MYPIFILFSCQILLLDGAKILAVFPTPSVSHQIVFRPLILALVEHGHEVTLITPDSVFDETKIPPNFKEIVVHDLSYKIWRDVFTTKLAEVQNDDVLTQQSFIQRTSKNILTVQMAVTDVQKILLENQEEFDLLLLEAWVRPALALTHVFKVPMIQISSFGGVIYNFKSIGVPTNPLIYPTVLNKKCYNLTIWEKIQEFCFQYQLEKLFDTIEQEDYVFLKKVFNPNIPTFTELWNNVHLLLLYSHTLWGDNRPVTNSVQNFRGIHERAAKQLPEDLQSYMDFSKRGVIYISFGTNVQTTMLPAEKIQIMIKVFSHLPYDVIWKWNDDTLPGRTKNIKISKWLPQPDLLKHPNLKLFITQGGLQSTDEAITAGVPVIGIPMFGDQRFNAEKYIYHKIGIKLEMVSLTEDEFRKSIETVINEESYRRNIRRLRSLMEDVPIPPLERAVRFIEYVVRHGGAQHLRSPAANLSWAEYYELDLIIISLFIIFLILSLVFYTLYHLSKVILIHLKMY